MCGVILCGLVVLHWQNFKGKERLLWLFPGIV